MGRVRQAGFLFRKEKGALLKHWCVIRDNSFIVYPNQPKIQNLLPDSDGSPIYILPVEEITAKSLVISTEENKKEPEFWLEIYNAKSGEKILFYCGHASALEKWLDAIRAEASPDDVTLQNLPQNAPLPPEVNLDSLPLSSPSPLLTPFSSHFGKNTLSLRYLNHVEGIASESAGNFLINSNKTKSSSKQSLQSPLPRDLDNKKNVTSRASDASLASDDPKNCKTQNLTNRTENESSTSSPIRKIPDGVTMRDTSRLRSSTSQQDHPPSHASNFTPDKKHIAFEAPETEVQKNVGSGFGGSGSETNTKTLSESFKKEEKRKKLGKFYTAGRSTSKKRWTISEISERDSSELENFHHEIVKEKTRNQNKTSKQFFHTIAPLSNLDFSLQQRKKKKRPTISLLSEQIQPTIEQEESDSSSAEENSSMHTSYQSHSSSLSADQFKRNYELRNDHLSHDKHRNKESSPQPGSLGLSLSVTNLVRIDSRSTPDLTKVGKVLKRNESIGSRVRKRMGSPASKRNQSFGGSTGVISPLAIKTPDYDTISGLKQRNDVSHENAGANSSLTLKEGWLYKRKMMAWSKLWACLTADKMLCFYKSQQKHLKPEICIDLCYGCDVDDIAQDKNINIFWLVPTKQVNKVKSKYSPESSTQKLWKPLQLMCKSTEEFVHWMKQLVLLNSTSALAKTRVNSLEQTTSEPNEHKPFFKKELNNNWKGQSTVDFDNSSLSSEPKSLDSLSFDTSLQHHLDRSSVSSAAEIRAKRHSSIDGCMESVSSSTNNLVGFDSRDDLFNEAVFENSPNEEISKAEKRRIKQKLKSRLSGKGNSAGDLDNAASDFFENRPVAKEKVSNSNPLEYQAFLKKARNNRSDSESEAETAGFLPNSAGAPDKISRLIESKNKKHSANLNGVPVQMREQTEAISLEQKPNRNNEEAGVKRSISKTRNRGDKNRSRHKIHIYSNSKQCDVSSSSETVSASDSNDVTCGDDAAQAFSHLLFSQQSTNSFESNRKTADSVSRLEQKHPKTVRGNLEKETAGPLLPRAKKQFKKLQAVDLKSSEGSMSVIANHKTDTLSYSNQSLQFSDLLCKNLGLTSVKLNSSDLDKVDKLRATASALDLTLLNIQQHDNLKRSSSDGNLLEPSAGERYRMKKNNKAIRELTHIDFIEIYGVPKHITISEPIIDMKQAVKSTIKRRNSLESDESSVHVKDFYEGSSPESPSAVVLPNKAPATRVSSGSATSEESTGSRHGWFFSVTPKLRKSVKRPQDDFKKSSKDQIFQIPASQLKTASHRGFLEKRDKRKHWEKFWCVFQDACLYLYNTPQSEATRNAILVRGYDVIADITKTNCEKFEFRLQREGARTLHFCTDNYQEFLLWVATLEKETRSVKKNQERKTSESKRHYSSPDILVEDFPSDGSSTTPSPMLLKRSSSQERLEKEIVEMQKHKLLKEIASEREKLLIEQRALHCLSGDEHFAEPVDNRARRKKRESVIRKYEQARDAEEAKATKSMAFLNRRRNSAQLKLDQITKELAPKSGKKRTDDHQHFAALEAKQTEMKKRLQEVDSEISQLQANKQNALEKIRERQELELLLTEQQEGLEIFLKFGKNGNATRIRKRHQSKGSQKTLSSIDEMIVDETDSSSSTSSKSSGPEGKVLRSKLTFFDGKRSGSPPTVLDNLNKDLHPISILRTLSSDSPYSYDNFSRSYSFDNVSKPLSLSSSISSANSKKESTTSASRANKNEVDPSVMASIEDFELFSAKMLQKLKK